MVAWGSEQHSLRLRFVQLGLAACSQSQLPRCRSEIRGILPTWVTRTRSIPVAWDRFRTHLTSGRPKLLTRNMWPFSVLLPRLTRTDFLTPKWRAVPWAVLFEAVRLEVIPTKLRALG